MYGSTPPGYLEGLIFGILWYILACENEERGKTDVFAGQVYLNTIKKFRKADVVVCITIKLNFLTNQNKTNGLI